MVKALIVDDEPLIRRGLSAMLQHSKYSFESIELAGNGIEALQKIRSLCPDLLFTDIRMPKMNGLELCREVHQQFPHVAMVVITGYEDFDYARQCIGYGVKDYLLKPVVPVDIYRLLDQWSRETEAVLSVSWVDGWIERTVDAIWECSQARLLQHLQEWKTYSFEANLQNVGFYKLLNDGLTTVQRRMESKRYHPAIYQIKADSGREEALSQFEEQLTAMLQELLLQRKGQDLVQMAIQFVEQNLSQDVSLETVAERVGLTPQYLSLIFKKTTKETFIHYRTQKRIECAKKLLEIPHYRTADVAMEVGYENYPHFSKTFKKETGLSPQAYRQRMGIR